MNTPTEAQLNDPKWWDDRAGTATHYCTDIGQFLDYNRHYALSGKSCCVPRPTTPPAPEWDGEGLPPVGVECECMRHGLWVKCEVRAHGEDHACPVAFVQTEFDCQVLDERMFRPIRTKEQRERHEAIKAAKSVIKDALIVNQLDDDTERGLEALYDAGMLRKAGGE